MREGVSISEAGRRLGVVPSTIRKWMDAGDLKFWVTPTGVREVSKESIDRLIREREEALADPGE